METAELQYRDYSGTSEYSPEDGLFHGRIARIRDMVTYEGHSPEALAMNFRATVDEYIAFCQAEGKEPLSPV